MTDEELKQMASAMGKKGGSTTKEKYGTEHYKRISRLGVEARKKNKQMERAAKTNVKSAGRSGSARSRGNARYAKSRSFNAAYQYGYDPNESMR